MAEYKNHLIKTQQEIEALDERLTNIAKEIIAAEENGDSELYDSLCRTYIEQGKVMLEAAKKIQERYNYIRSIDIEPSFDMTWLYVTMMKAMQNTYDNGIASMHIKLVKQWPELTEWIRDRRNH